MAITLSYDDSLARVKIEYSTTTTHESARVMRTDNPAGIGYQTIRGGAEIPAGVGVAYDYEFLPSQVNYYRVEYLDAAGGVVLQEVANITPELDAVWLKSVAHPYLNRKLWLVDVSEISSPMRGGVFDVVGRSYPVAVSDIRSSRQFSITVATDTRAEAEDFLLCLSVGGPALLHVPPDCPLPVDTMYVQVGNVTQEQPSRYSEVRIFDLDLVEIAPPGPDLVGSTITWSGVVNEFATWNAVVSSVATWNDLLSIVGKPGDVIVE